MSNKNARAIKAPPMPSPSNGQRPTIEIGPATLNVFSQVLTQTDVSKAQILTLLEARGVIGEGNYRLVITGARLLPDDSA